MTKVDKACLSKPLDGVSDSGRRARARKHTNRSPTNFSQSNSTVMQWQGSSQRFRKNGVPPSCALRPRASATHSAFSATDYVSCLSPPFGPRSSSSVPFGLFGGSGAICPFEILRLDVAGSGSSPIRVALYHQSWPPFSPGAIHWGNPLRVHSIQLRNRQTGYLVWALPCIGSRIPPSPSFQAVPSLVG